MNEKVDLFIYSHVPFKCAVSNPVYKVLTNSHAPDGEFQTKLPIYRDWEGEGSLSDKNLMYNEYSGFNWILKNWRLKEYIGMMHYRRFYTFMDEVPDIDSIFSFGFKIILNERFPLNYAGNPRSNREFYQIWHNVDDFDLMGQIVKGNYPQYADGWDKMAGWQYIYPSSLFIMQKDMFKEYITFALDVMDKFNQARGCNTPEEWIAYVEQHKDQYIRPQHKYYTVQMQSRATGYLVERCLCAFLLSGDDPIVNHSAEYPWTVLRKERWLPDPPQTSAITKNMTTIKK